MHPWKLWLPLAAFAVFALDHAGAADPLGDAALDSALATLKTWKFGQPRDATFAIEAHIGAIGNDPGARAALGTRLAALLSDPAIGIDATGVVCRLLSLAGGSSEIPALARLLRSREHATIARFAIERIGGAAATDALLAALATGAPDRIGLIGSLGELRAEAAVDPLARLARSGDRPVAGAACIALGRIGTGPAAFALLDAGDGAMASQAWERGALACADRLAATGTGVEAKALLCDALLRPGPPARPARIRAAAFAIDLRAGPPREARERLLAALCGDDAALRRGAIQHARSAPQPAVLAEVASRFDGLSPAGRAELIPLLATLGAAARDAIAGAATSPDPTVRLQALAHLGEVGGADDAMALVAVAAGDDETARDAARRSLRGLRDAGVDARLIAGASAASGKAKAEIFLALADRGAVAAVDILLPALGEADAGVRDAARRALCDLADGSHAARLLALVRADIDEGRRRAIEAALVAAGRRGGLDPILAALGSGDVPARVSIASVLGGIGGDRALGALRGALGDPEIEVRLAAVRALGSWEDATPARDLVALAERSQDPRCKALALRGAGDLVTRARDLPPVIAAGILDAAIAAAAGTGEEDALLALKARVEGGGRRPSGIEGDTSAAVAALFASPDNLARGATASNPDGLQPDGRGQGPHAAIDGDPKTYWDEVDGRDLYQIRVELRRPATVDRLRILSFRHQDFAPRDFVILLDGVVVRRIVGAEYDRALLTIDLPPTPCRAVQLDITGYYGGSPAIRELGISGKPSGE